MAEYVVAVCGVETVPSVVVYVYVYGILVTFPLSKEHFSHFTVFSPEIIYISSFIIIDEHLLCECVNFEKRYNVFENDS